MLRYVLKNLGISVSFILMVVYVRDYLLQATAVDVCLGAAFSTLCYILGVFLREGLVYYFQHLKCCLCSIEYCSSMFSHFVYMFHCVLTSFVNRLCVITELSGAESHRPNTGERWTYPDRVSRPRGLSCVP